MPVSQGRLWQWFGIEQKLTSVLLRIPNQDAEGHVFMNSGITSGFLNQKINKMNKVYETVHKRKK